MGEEGLTLLCIFRAAPYGDTYVELYVHHNTYANYGEAKLEDLIVLCKTCHKDLHLLETTS